MATDGAVLSDRGRLGRLLVAGRESWGGRTVQPPQSGADWLRLIRLADKHLVLPALERALVRLDSLPDDPAIADVLTTVARANAERNTALRAQLVTVGRSLNDAGFEACLLKGAIRLVDDLYPDPAWRYLSDLDILLPEAQAHEAWRHLVGLGYREKPLDSALPRLDHHHLPALRHPHCPAWIEVHKALGYSRGGRLLPAGDVWSASDVIEVGGSTFRVPTTDHQLAHAIGHQFLQHRGHLSGTLLLRDLLEVYCLAARPDGDVAACRERFAAIGRVDQMDACLLLVDRAFGSGWASEPSRYSRLLATVGAAEHEKASIQAIRWYITFNVKGIGYLFANPKRLIRNVTSVSFYGRRIGEFRRLYNAIGR